MGGVLYITEPLVIWSNLETQIRGKMGPGGPPLKAEVLPCSLVLYVQRVVVGKSYGVHVAMQDGREFEFIVGLGDEAVLNTWLAEAEPCVS